MISMRFFLVVICFLLAAACGEAPANKTNSVANTAKTPVPQLPVYGYEIVKEYPHDSRAFTQGLIFHNGFLYESTGQEGASTVRKVDITTGKVLQKFDLPKTDFGEGITLLNGKIYVLTWRGGIGYVLNADTLTLEKEFNYLGEGWGITNDGTNLFITQGAHVLKVIDPSNFNTVKTIPVMQPNGQPLMQLNEMEFIKGEIWANIWHSEDPKILGKPNYIARINPTDGKLLGWINLAGISPDDVARSSENTLNGIAHDPATDRIFVTGKNWRKLFEIKIKEPQAQ
jgi:glutaminyl-peptide cyclotransferase